MLKSKKYVCFILVIVLLCSFTTIAQASELEKYTFTSVDEKRGFLLQGYPT